MMRGKLSRVLNFPENNAYCYNITNIQRIQRDMLQFSSGLRMGELYDKDTFITDLRRTAIDTSGAVPKNRHKTEYHW